MISGEKVVHPEASKGHTFAQRVTQLHPPPYHTSPPLCPTHPVSSLPFYIKIHRLSVGILSWIPLDLIPPPSHSILSPVYCTNKIFISFLSSCTHTSCTLFQSHPIHINNLHHHPFSTNPQSRTHPSLWYLRSIVAPEIHHIPPPYHTSSSPHSLALIDYDIYFK